LISPPSLYVAIFSSIQLLVRQESFHHSSFYLSNVLFIHPHTSYRQEYFHHSSFYFKQRSFHPSNFQLGKNSFISPAEMENLASSKGELFSSTYKLT